MYLLSSFVFENIEENCFQVHVAAGMRDGVCYIISYSRLLNFVPFQQVKYPITTHAHAHAHTRSSSLQPKLFQHVLRKIFGVVHCSALCSINIYLNGAVSSVMKNEGKTMVWFWQINLWFGESVKQGRDIPNYTN